MLEIDPVEHGPLDKRRQPKTADGDELLIRMVEAESVLGVSDRRPNDYLTSRRNGFHEG